MSKFDPYEHLKVVLNKDGTLTRLVALPTTPATGEAATGHTVLSKDVTLDEKKATSMRIYRPAQIASNTKLPIIIYFRNGSWIGFSVAVSILHENCNKLSAQVPAIVVSVDYRNAPENRLPSQYDDAMDAVDWVNNQALDANGDKWLNTYGDFSRCYLYGTSCGANVAYNAALRCVDHKLDGITLAGMILNQPLFGGKKRTKSELKLATDQYFPLPVIDVLWELALPPGTDRDHRFCNPMMDEPSKAKLHRLGKFLVIGFGGDTLIDRQQDFVQMLVMNGAKVEARFDDVGFHGIEMIDPRRSAAIVSFIKDFV